MNRMAVRLMSVMAFIGLMGLVGCTGNEVVDPEDQQRSISFAGSRFGFRGTGRCVQTQAFFQVRQTEDLIMENG